MELQGKDLGEYKRILFKTMKAFIAFCKKNNLRYYGCGGTALGAVRHNGIIPWDDDIDVYMPRVDYDRFLKMKKSADLGPYEILDYSCDGYYLPFAKFCDKNTTILEHKQYPFVIGVFIDIFPLDDVGPNIDKAAFLSAEKKRKFKRYLHCIVKHSFTDVIDSIRAGRIRHLARIVLDTFFYRYQAKHYRKNFTEFENIIKRESGDCWMYYAGFYSLKKEIEKKEWFQDGFEHNFEDFKITIPKMYDSYLTNKFGDYMTPPPENKRITHHYHYYFNLEKRVPVDEILKMNIQDQKAIDFQYE